MAINKSELKVISKWLVGRSIVEVGYDKNQVLHLTLDDDSILIVSTTLFAKGQKKNVDTNS